MMFTGALEPHSVAFPSISGEETCLVLKFNVKFLRTEELTVQQTGK